MRASIPLLLAFLLRATSAWSQAPPLTESGFKLDMHQGPIVGNSRVIGLGGAYTAMAEGTAGIPFNAASVSQRTYHSRKWFDYDYDWDLLAPGAAMGELDYFNSGYATDKTFLAFSVGGSLQFGGLGVGIFLRGSGFDFQDQRDPPEKFTSDQLIANLAVGYAFWDHRLHVGAGFRAGNLKISSHSQGTIYESPALGGDVGILFRPRELPLRLGLAYESPLHVTKEISCQSGICPAGFYMPSGIVAPWQVRLGAAWQFGFEGQTFSPRPQYRMTEEEKPKWVDGDMEGNYIGGKYLTVSTDLAIAGTVDNAISLAGFASQTNIKSGEKVSLSPRFGVESEVWKRRLRLRAGGYWEPSRSAGISGRMHGTFAMQVRMFDIKIPLWGWRGLSFSSALDLARKYSNLSFSVLTFWH